VFYENPEVEEIYEDRAGADENVREEGGVNFAEVAGEEAILCFGQPSKSL
jgi:hypothetical protein